MIKEIKNMLKNLEEFLTTKDKIYMDEVCELYEPVIKYPMSVNDAKDILEFIGKLKAYGISNQQIKNCLLEKFSHVYDA